MSKFVKKWEGHQFSTGSHPGDDYLRFQRDAKRSLRSMAESAGYELHEFLGNHYCFSAVLRSAKTGNFAYVSVGDVRGNARWSQNVLYRTMEHERDFRGGPNHFCDWDDLPVALSQLGRIGQ